MRRYRREPHQSSSSWLYWLGAILGVGFVLLVIGVSTVQIDLGDEKTVELTAPTPQRLPEPQPVPLRPDPQPNENQKALFSASTSERLKNLADAAHGKFPTWSAPPASPEEAAEREMIEAEAMRAAHLKSQIETAANSVNTQPRGEVRLIPVRPGYQPDTELRWPRASDVWGRSTTQHAPATSPSAPRRTSDRSTTFSPLPGSVPSKCLSCSGSGNGTLCKMCQGSGMANGFACGFCGGRRFSICMSCNGRGAR